MEGQTVFSLQEQMPKKVALALLLIWPSLEDESAAFQRLWKNSSNLNLSLSIPVSVPGAYLPGLRSSFRKSDLMELRAQISSLG